MVMMKLRIRLECSGSCDQPPFRNFVVKMWGWVMVDCGDNVVICVAAVRGFEVVRG